MPVTRYFAGYPRPRLRLAPLAFAAVWVVLAHPATTRLAAAVFMPVEKLPHDVVRLADVRTSRVGQPHESPEEPRSRCGSRRRHSPPEPVMIDAERLDLRRGTRSLSPAPSIVERMRASGRDRFRAVFEVCFDGDGRVETVRRLRRSGDPEWDAALADDIRGWRYYPYESWSHCRGRYRVHACTVERFRFDP
jgi:hypothetical protein